jgi:hypothetical protein
MVTSRQEKWIYDGLSRFIVALTTRDAVLQENIEKMRSELANVPTEWDGRIYAEETIWSGVSRKFVNMNEVYTEPLPAHSQNENLSFTGWPRRFSPTQSPPAQHLSAQPPEVGSTLEITSHENRTTPHPEVSDTEMSNGKLSLSTSSHSSSADSADLFVRSPTSDFMLSPGVEDIPVNESVKELGEPIQNARRLLPSSPRQRRSLSSDRPTPRQSQLLISTHDDATPIPSPSQQGIQNVISQSPLLLQQNLATDGLKLGLIFGDLEFMAILFKNAISVSRLMLGHAESPKTLQDLRRVSDGFEHGGVLQSRVFRGLFDARWDEISKSSTKSTLRRNMAEDGIDTSDPKSWTNAQKYKQRASIWRKLCQIFEEDLNEDSWVAVAGAACTTSKYKENSS